MSSSCTFTGHPETYGLGIRISFYVFWYTIPLSHWIARRETKYVRLTHSFLVAGTFLGLIIQTQRNVLRPVEIYIGILLVYAGFLVYVPLYVWRTLTCCAIPFDPERYPLVHTGPIYTLLHFFLLLATSIFKLWFWFDVVGDNRTAVRSNTWGFPDARCQEYGFFFSRVRLDARGFVVGNILLVFTILVGATFVGVVTVGKMMGRGWVRQIVDEEGESISVTSSEYDEIIDVGKIRETFLQELYTLLHLLTVSTVLAAIELTISWNSIRGINFLTSPSQTIPMIIAIGALSRVVYVALLGDLDEKYRIRRGESMDLGRWRDGRWGVWLGFRRRRYGDEGSVYSSRT